MRSNIQNICCSCNPFFGVARATPFFIPRLKPWAFSWHKSVRKIIFDHSGHNPMFEEPNSFDTHLVKWIYEEI
jgi:pimeloyl-ACP methyl ester carboxylesterase